MRKFAVFAYTRRGCEMARRVCAALSGADTEAAAYAPARFDEAGFHPIGQPAEPFYGALFREADALVFVGAAGVAVRCAAPHVRSKRADPAVLCLDETGRYVIPLLSGHIGGANALARRLADALGAEAAITTATDVNARFSVDAWAVEQGYLLDDLSAAKAVAAAILERDVPLCSDLPVIPPLPPGIVARERGDVGIYISWRKERNPFGTTLRLVPNALCVGLGCRRGTDAGTFRAVVEQVFQEHGIDLRAVRRAASIDRKADEPGLLAYCEAMGWPLSFYSAAELETVPGELVTPSAFVKEIAGVDNVCERAALLDAERLIVKKTALGGVTVAIAAERREVRFG